MHVEPELEAFLKNLAPGCDEKWVGATDDEIDEIEIHADVQLPRFYRWFLARMGYSMGPIANSRRDLTVTTVLSAYRQGLVPARPNLVLIGAVPDQIMPMHLYCDVSKPARDDALVCSYDPRGGFIQNEFETLREMIAWSTFVRFRMKCYAQQCIGTFRAEQGNILSQLEPALMPLGFRKALPSGHFLGIYERTDAALECSLEPLANGHSYMFFGIGADDESTIRSVLGTIAAEAWLQIEVREWIPPLSR